MSNVSEMPFSRRIDRRYDPETSIVLRYRDAFTFGNGSDEDSRFKDQLRRTSIREGARVFHLLTHKDVDLYVLDETSLMHTKTLKSIDGCVTAAHCKLRGYDKVVFESGGNTGTALTAYGVRAGLETYCLVPQESVLLLDSGVFKLPRAHLISVGKRGLVKEASRLFGQIYGLQHIPEVSWRYEASRFRGAFLLEYMLENAAFDWLAQTISAGFGPIGIYSVLRTLGKGTLRGIPRFLGVQQEANCPVYEEWARRRDSLRPAPLHRNGQLLSLVMYDSKPQTYGTFDSLFEALESSQGNLTTVNHSEFDYLLRYDFGGKGILELLEDCGISLNRKLDEKTGLISMAGVLKEIEKGTLAPGSRVLCCLTSGTSRAGGKALPEYNVTSLEKLAEDHKAPAPTGGHRD